MSSAPKKSKKSFKHLSYDVKQSIWAAHKAGMTSKVICMTFSVSRATVFRVLSVFRIHGKTVSKKEKRGQK
jgi:hypothetical protein